MASKVLSIVMFAIICSTFFCGCDQGAMDRVIKAVNNTEADEKEAKSVTYKFFDALTSGNATTAEYYLASDAEFNREKMRSGSQVLAAMGGWEIEILGVTVSGKSATVDLVMKLYGREDKKTASCVLKKENDKWKVVTFK